jgi:hypothetical protein
LGPMRIASPSSYRTFTDYSLPVSRRTSNLSHACSRTTSTALLSARSPRKTGWRISESLVHSVNLTSPTSLGISHVVVFSSLTFSSKGFLSPRSGCIASYIDLQSPSFRHCRRRIAEWRINRPARVMCTVLCEQCHQCHAVPSACQTVPVPSVPRRMKRSRPGQTTGPVLANCASPFVGSAGPALPVKIVWLKRLEMLPEHFVQVGQRVSAPACFHSTPQRIAENLAGRQNVNMGTQMVREVASKTSDQTGDGTTTATVLAHAIVTAPQISSGRRWITLRRRRGGGTGGHKFASAHALWLVGKLIQHARAAAEPLHDSEMTLDDYSGLSSQVSAEVIRLPKLPDPLQQANPSILVYRMEVWRSRCTSVAERARESMLCVDRGRCNGLNASWQNLWLFRTTEKGSKHEPRRKRLIRFACRLD